MVKNPPAGDTGWIPGLGRSPGEGNGNPLQYSCLKIPWTEEPGGLYSPQDCKRVRHNSGAKQQEQQQSLSFPLFIFLLESRWQWRIPWLLGPSGATALIPAEGPVRSATAAGALSVKTQQLFQDKPWNSQKQFYTKDFGTICVCCQTFTETIVFDDWFGIDKCMKTNRMVSPAMTTDSSTFRIYTSTVSLHVCS